MRIGFDCDGILANFIPAYQALTVKVAGCDLFAPNDVNHPPCWDWPQYRGYSADTMAAVWQRIATSPNFWLGLEPIWDSMNTLALCIEDLEQNHDVYFITARPGYRAKRQTESWLKTYLPYDDDAIHPTVLLSNNKGAAAKALKLDAYVDDNLDNVKAVLQESQQTRVYLLNKSYNQGDVSICVINNPTPFNETAPAWFRVEKGEYRSAIRITTLGDMLTRELVTPQS